MQGNHSTASRTLSRARAMFGKICKTPLFCARCKICNVSAAAVSSLRCVPHAAWCYPSAVLLFVPFLPPLRPLRAALKALKRAKAAASGVGHYSALLMLHRATNVAPLLATTGRRSVTSCPSMLVSLAVDKRSRGSRTSLSSLSSVAQCQGFRKCP